MKTSPINTIEKEKLQEILTNSKTYGQVLKYFGLKNHGSNPETLKNRIKRDDLNAKHLEGFRFGGGWNKGCIGVTQKKWTLERALSELFIKTEKEHIINQVKKSIKEFNLIPYKCSECNLETIWNNKPITLEIDHIDGDSQNHQLSNLRWICPNCHSQTDTFRGRNPKRLMNLPTAPKTFCKCGNEIYKQSTRCGQCQPTKIQWPNINQMNEILKMNNFNLSKVGKTLGVSDNAIRKHCKKFNITF